MKSNFTSFKFNKQTLLYVLKYIMKNCCLEATMGDSVDNRYTVLSCAICNTSPLQYTMSTFWFALFQIAFLTIANIVRSHLL